MPESDRPSDMSEPDPDGYQPEPEKQADTTDSDQLDTTDFESDGFGPRRRPSRRPGTASPVRLLAWLAGVIALVFAVVAIFLLLPARSHDTAAISSPTRGATTPSRVPSPKLARPRATGLHKQPAKAQPHATHPAVAEPAAVGPTSPTSASDPQAPPVLSGSSAPQSSGSSAAGAATVEVGGEVTCLSGKSVEGVWVQANVDAGFAPWQGVTVSGKAFGSTSKWWWWLPSGESYSLHVGCGGTQASWAVATYTPVVSGTPNSFDCIDIASEAGYGTCYEV